MTKLIKLMSKEEGFGKPGTIPTIRHNPLDLRHSPHSSHQGEGSNDIGVIDNDVDGWADAERQAQLAADRGETLGQFIAIMAPPSQNDTSRYIADICRGMGMGPKTPMREVLKVVV